MGRPLSHHSPESTSQVLDATLRVIVKGGVDAVRYRAVADEAGVSLGTVSYHYASREELIRAALTHYLEECVRELFALRARFKSPTLGDIADYVAELVRKDFADPRRWVLAEYELMVYASRDRELARALERYEEAMTAELAATLERLGLRSPFAAARTIAELIRGHELSRLAGCHRELADFKARVRMIVTAFSNASSTDHTLKRGSP